MRVLHRQGSGFDCSRAELPRWSKATPHELTQSFSDERHRRDPGQEHGPGTTGVVIAGGPSARLVAIRAQVLCGVTQFRHGRRRFSFRPPTWGDLFSGPFIPFGALVHAVPSALHK